MAGETGVIFAARVADGVVLYGLHRGCFECYRHTANHLIGMSLVGLLWPYFVAKVIDNNPKRSTVVVVIDEIPDWVPLTARVVQGDGCD
jgi:hypothetical protein